jgi:hypothetical protein
MKIHLPSPHVRTIKFQPQQNPFFGWCKYFVRGAGSCRPFPNERSIYALLLSLPIREHNYLSKTTYTFEEEQRKFRGITNIRLLKP